jgi:serine/threonine protein kinase
MIKWIIPFILSAVCALTAPFWQLPSSTTRQVIYLRGGEPVVADTVTESEQFVFYTADGKNGMFMKNDVTSIGSLQVDRDVPVIAIVDRLKNRWSDNLGPVGGWLRHMDGRILVFLVLLPVFIGLVILVNMFSRLIKKPSKPATPATAPGSDATSLGDPASQESHELSELRDIVWFFTELYRLQNGFPANTPSRFSMTAASAKHKMKVFELRLKGSSDWLTRRMSIGRLGEDTGSKSTCYYVIYDTHMVVKIPPTPVTDMDKYTTDIRREIKIAAQLAPVACIVPMVSVVMKKIKKLPFADSLTPEQLEKRYIRLVEEQPEYQEYLTIGGRFAFFMELSNSFFLGRVIDELHDAKENIANELYASSDIAWNQEVFTTRYGLASLPVFEGLQNLYRSCAAEAKRIIQNTGQGILIHEYQLKNWFLATIAGDDTWDHKGIDTAVVEKIRNAFSRVFNANQDAVDALIQLLKQELAAKTFSKSRNQIENIASNMLTLLCQLKTKGIALRDLKPDNLFLNAAPDEYPVFLNDREAFAIGVIDVETAISLETTSDGTIAQPLLGGTPLYATPLHVFKNETIQMYFGNPAELLHLQDWFATIAIIFKIGTGSNLFPRAARSFPGILKLLKACRSKADPDEATVKAMSQKFWSAAATDMKSRLSAAKETLRQLSLHVPDDMLPVIRAELQRQVKMIDQTIRTKINWSSLLRRDSNKAFLLEANSQEIRRQQQRWQNESDLPASHREIAPRMVALLGKLYHLKQRIAEKQGTITALSGSGCRMPAHILMETMFQIVFRRMYQSHWDAVTPTSSVSPSTPPRDTQDKVTAILDDDENNQ